MAIGLLVAIAGCGGGKPDGQADSAGGTQDDQRTQSVTNGRDAQDARQPSAGASATGQSPVQEARRSGQGAPTSGAIDVTFISEDFIAAVVAHPHRVLESKLYREISLWPGMQFDEFTEFTGIDPHDVDQVMVLFDKTTAAGAAQLPFAGRGASEFEPPAEEFRLEDPGSLEELRQRYSEDPGKFDDVPKSPPPTDPERGLEFPGPGLDEPAPLNADHRELGRPRDVPQQPEAADEAAANIEPSGLAPADGDSGLNELQAQADVTSESFSLEFSDQLGPQIQRRNLGMIGLAMHNYHVAYGQFPNADSAAEGAGKGLSWRVHLLPYLDEQELYRRFKLDEPWDSEHNRELVESMPAVFAPAVAPSKLSDIGRTTLHVFVGDSVPFGDGQRPRLAEFRDGASNTLLVVESGADAGVEWTKPGGLEFDPDNPKQMLGTLPDNGFLALFADGRVERLRSDISGELFRTLATHQGEEPVSEDDLAESVIAEPEFEFGGMDSDFAQPPPPATIVRLRRDVEPQKLMNEAFSHKTYTVDRDGTHLTDTRPPQIAEQEHGGRTYFVVEGSVQPPPALHFPDPRTVIIAHEESLRAMLEAREVESPLIRRLRQVDASADLIVVADLSSSREELEQTSQMLAEAIPPLFAGLANMAAQVKSLELTVNVTSPSSKLFTLMLQTDDPQLAGQLNQVVGSLVAGGQQAYQQWRQGGQPSPPQTLEPVLPLVDEIVANVSTSATGDEFTLSVSKPADFDRLPELLRPAMEEARLKRERASRLMNLRNIGLAMHNYHDVYGHFPYADRSSRPDDPNRGLGWRLHLAPYVDAAPEYYATKLDEPWDSEHNRQRLPQIPSLYATPGADEGRTTIHLFVGE
ncbi:MAG TPA: DUF1559 domain-containing protein, partial [Planctomycetaceae bacterium]|nr:DUF1559 domain-containing protein [Planctomycetaceae bacterium]